ncbi:MAG: IS481 family transposase, partial [Wolbachia endosymbiont of Alcedoecus sp.]|nr:IS481 family transposase [Wolbachia endosymbiont of Alcedoecus sp.]
MNKKIIKRKLGLTELAKQLENASKACKAKGYSRDTFNWFGELYENGEEEALHEIGKKRLLFTNRVPEHIEKAVIEIAIELPA